MATFPVTINIGDSKRGVLTVKLRNNGDLLLILKAANYSRDASCAFTNERRIVENRYSIHRSPNSAHKINAIKQTFTLDNGELLNTHLYTPAIKAKSGFVHIYSRYFPNLSNDRYLLNGEQNIPNELSLGNYDPSAFTLIMSVFVAASDFETPNIQGDTNQAELVIGDFKLLFTWSFITLGSSSSGYYEHSMTIPMKDGSVTGAPVFDRPEDIKNFIDERRSSLTNELAKTLCAQYKIPEELVLTLRDLTGYLTQGVRRSEEWMQKLKDLHRRGLAEELSSVLRGLASATTIASNNSTADEPTDSSQASTHATARTS